MRRVIAAAGFVAALCVSTASQAVECPKDINPCRVMFLAPMELEWLAGNQKTAANSALDLAVRSGGADSSPFIAQILMRARTSVEGTAPPEPPQDTGAKPPEKKPEPPAPASDGDVPN